MRTILFGTVALLLAIPVRGWTVDDPAPAQVPGPPPGGSPPPSAPGGDLDTHPWNPDVPHANEWPYQKPLHIDTDYFGPPGEFWLRGEYYLWSLEAAKLPPLVTAGPPGSGAVPGAPGVGLVIGDNKTDLPMFSGARFTGGTWFESSYSIGLEGSYFFLAEEAAKYGAAASGQPGAPDLGRPFFNVLTGKLAAFTIAGPGAPGTVSVQAQTELQGGEAILVWNLGRGPSFSFTGLGGFRYQELGDHLTIGDATTVGVPRGTIATTIDEFSSRNQFYGGELGGRAEYRWRCLVFTLTEKLALGANTADIEIVGNTVLTPPAGAATATGTGLLAQPSNAGRHEVSTFAAINELSLQAGWQINDNVQAFVGWMWIYSSAVIRPGDLVDLGVNPLLGTTGPVRPGFVSKETSFWADGLNVGLEVRY